MIAVVVDSTSQMPAVLAERHGIIVVPLTVTVDGVDHLEWVPGRRGRPGEVTGGLDADAFYAAWSDGHVPEIVTSQPSPGRFVEAYRAAAAAGATAIVSVHITEAMSGTLNSARLAAREVDVPVRLVDTGTASFGVACCALAAAEVVAEGATPARAADAAAAVAARLRTSFVVGVPRLIDRSGRAGGLGVEAASGDGVPVIAMTGPEIEVLATAGDLDAAVAVMVADALAHPVGGRGRRIAIGTSDSSSEPLGRALEERIRGASSGDVVEIVRYRIGPSVGAHTGPGTAGLFVY